MLISIIIPVYNSKKYIEKCIDSLINQSYKNIEIIIIDDGSRDKSPSICRKLSKKDKRIKVFSKMNGGTSSARNYGIKKSTGDYITFIDNDDYWDDKESLKRIVKQLKESNADILLFNSKNYYMNTNKISTRTINLKRNEIINKDRNEALKIILENGVYARAVWTKMIKSSLIKNNNIVFEEGKRNEDTDFSAKLMMHAKSYDYYEEVFHVYRKGHEYAQTSKTVSLKSLNDLEYVLKSNIEQSNKIKDEGLKKCVLAFLAYPFCVWMGQVGYFKEKKKKIKLMKKYKYILNYDYDKRVKLTKRVCKIIGFKNTCFILNIFMRFRYKKKR